jgi:hypothetical protein
VQRTGRSAEKYMQSVVYAVPTAQLPLVAPLDGEGCIRCVSVTWLLVLAARLSRA